MTYNQSTPTWFFLNQIKFWIGQPSHDWVLWSNGTYSTNSKTILAIKIVDVCIKRFYMMREVQNGCVDFCYRLIFINKFIIHSQVNDPYCEIKYFDLHIFLNFSNFFLLLLMIFFIYINYYQFIWLYTCMGLLNYTLNFLRK